VWSLSPTPSPLRPALLLTQGSTPVPVRETSSVTALHLPASLHGLEMQICMLKCTAVKGKGFKDKKV